MQILKYNLIARDEEGDPVMGAAVTLGYSQDNLALARAEAWQGQVTVEEDDGSEPEQTQLQRIAELEAALDMLLSGVTQ